MEVFVVIGEVERSQALNRYQLTDWVGAMVAVGWIKTFGDDKVACLRRLSEPAETMRKLLALMDRFPAISYHVFREYEMGEDRRRHEIHQQLAKLGLAYADLTKEQRETVDAHTGE